MDLRIKRFGLAIATATAFLAVLAFCVPLLTPEHMLRKAVSDSVLELTGRAPLIDGEVRFSLIPLPSVTVERIVVPGGDIASPLLEADQVKARLRWWPLLAGRFEIASMTLTNPNLSLIELKDARRSWSFKSGVLARIAKGDGSPSLPVSSLRFLNGSIFYSSAVTRRANVLAVQDATISWPRFAGAMTLDGIVDWRKRNADVSVTVTEPAKLIAGDKSDIRLRVRGDLLNMNVSGSMSSDGRFEGHLAASGSSLRQTLNWLGAGLSDGSSLAAFSVESPVIFDKHTAALGAVDLEIDGNSAEGALTVQLGENRPVISGTLAAERLDLLPYFSTSSKAIIDSGRLSTGPIIIQNRIPGDIDLRISSAETMFGKVKLGAAAATVSLHQDLWNIALGEAAAYGGTLSGSLTLRHGADGLDVNASGRFSSIDVGKALPDFFAFHKFEGTGAGMFELSAKGRSFSDLLKALAGQAQLSIDQGALTGVDMVDLLRKLEKRPLSTRVESAYNGRTTFDKLQGNFRIANGKVLTRDSQLAGGGLFVMLEGQTDLISRALDLTGMASLQESDGSAPFKLPFRMLGDWSSPVLEPDTEALIYRSGAAAPLLREILKSSQGAVRRTQPVAAPEEE